MSKYNNLTSTELDVEMKRRYYTSIIDPEIPKQSDDIYVVSTFGDRLDLLAWNYYQNVDYWWIIAAANPELRKDTLNLEIGTQIRIPKDFQSATLLLQQQIISR
jgi:phage tail protein X